MCLFYLQIAKRATVFVATPTEVVLRSTNLSVLRHRSTPLVALLSVMLLAGCADRELYKSVQGQTVRDLGLSPDGNTYSLQYRRPHGQLCRATGSMVHAFVRV